VLSNTNKATFVQGAAHGVLSINQIYEGIQGDIK
jgi:hypothetical protein